jgi:dTDP-4-amino-4,6-dideoxygalactose transaminase
LCGKHRLALIEDCAQSFGARIGDRHTGTFGACGAFSFFPSKNLGAYGDGGMITTNSEAHAARLKMLRNHGSSVRYHHDVVGYNSRLDELQAVVLRIKLRRIDDYNDKRRKVARLYSDLFNDTDLQLPSEVHGHRHVYHQYTILTPRRDAVAAHLQAAGIASAIYYPIPLHRQAAFDEYRTLELPVAEQISKSCLSLPMYPELRETAVRAIAAKVKEALIA